MINKKGQLLLIGIIIAGVIIASIFGLVFLNKIIGAIGKTGFFIALGILLAVIFHNVVESILMAILGFIKSLLHI